MLDEILYLVAEVSFMVPTIHRGIVKIAPCNPTRWDKTINEVYYSTVNVVNARLKYDYSYSSMI